MALDFIIPLNSPLLEVLNQHLDWKYEGDKKPRGSHSELIVDRIPHLVAGLLVDTVLKLPAGTA